MGRQHALAYVARAHGDLAALAHSSPSGGETLASIGVYKIAAGDHVPTSAYSMTGKLWGKSPAELAAITKPKHDDMPVLAWGDDEQSHPHRLAIIAVLTALPWCFVLALGYVIGKFW